MEIVVLQKDELEQLMRRVADMAVGQLRDELGRSQTPELMTRDQLKDYLNCHRSTIPRYIRDGMPVEQLGEHQRFRKSDIDLWLKDEWASTKNTTASDSKTPRTRTGHEAPGTFGNGSAAV